MSILFRTMEPKLSPQQAADRFAAEYWPGWTRKAVDLKGGWKHVARSLSEYSGTFSVTDGVAVYRLACSTAGEWTVTRIAD
jgi:hypothetical protein